MRYIMMLAVVALTLLLVGCAADDTGPRVVIGDDIGADDSAQQGQDTVSDEKFCDDSDNGVTYFVKGEVVDNAGKHVDACESSDMLREYYCSGDEMRYEDYDCLYGCFEGTCREEASDDVPVEEEESESAGDDAELVFCGSRQSVLCPEGFACFPHPAAQKEWGVCQEYSTYDDEDEDYYGLIKCPPVRIDDKDCPKGLDTVCATYFDTVKQRDTYKKFDSPCLACADTGTIGYKFGRC